MKNVIIISLVIVGALVVALLANKLPDTVPSPSNSVSRSNSQTALQGMIGKPASDFTLPSTTGRPVTLSSLRGKNIILFFSEGIACYPACWNQIAALKNSPELEKRNTLAFSIVPDSANSWQQAIKKMPELAAAAILLDTDKKVSTQYGMLSVASSMHRGSVPGHSYVIADKDGVVRYVKDDVQMGIRNDELFAQIDKLQ